MPADVNLVPLTLDVAQRAFIHFAQETKRRCVADQGVDFLFRRRVYFDTGEDEFQFLRAYRVGDSPRRIAWHVFARERGLLTKQFAAEVSGEIWLDLQLAPEAALEAKLSRLARWILDAESANIPYGLRLPGIEIPPAKGNMHRHRCLEQLALYGS